MTDCIPCFDLISKGQSFPKNIIKRLDQKGTLFGDDAAGEVVISDSISNEGHEHFREYYKDADLSKRRPVLLYLWSFALPRI